MAGIYIHIPFCKQACHYCDFHFVTSLRHTNELAAALLKETELRKDYLDKEPISTIYFGGGTPSLLSTASLRSQIEKIRQYFIVEPGAEITIETNPDDINEETLIAWGDAGINRLSIGVQSFFNEDLQWMNRAHDARQAVNSLQLAVKHFDNITLDLIYGTPLLTNEKWKKNIETAISLNIPHLSCYALTVEPKTPLYKMIRQHKTEDVDSERQSEQFLLLMKWMEEADYEHYEISNFAKPGYRSQHNSSYWQGKKYLGLGPSAHSFNGDSRQWNIANNNNYITSIEKNIIPFEKEELTSTQRMNEYIMTSLRTLEGLNLSAFAEENSHQLLSIARKYIQEGKMIERNGMLVLTREGKLLADGIAADLFF